MNLQNLGVQEMNAREVVSIDGGTEHHYEYGGASNSGGFGGFCSHYENGYNVGYGFGSFLANFVEGMLPF